MWPLGLTEREGSSGRFSDPGSAVQVVNFWRAHPGQFWLAPKLQDLLLEGLPEPLDDAVGLRLPDISQALADAEVLQFPLKVIGDILAAVVVAQC